MMRYLTIIAWIIVFECVGAFMGRTTQDNLSWYFTLNKSSLTPPSIAFSIVWTILYAIIAYVGFRLWEDRSKSKSLWYLYLVNVILNWLWTIIFFQYHWIGFSFGWIIALTLLTLIMTINLFKNYRNLGYLFLLYFAWLCVASYLNGVIWLTN